MVIIGGLFVVETFLQQPDLFQGYVAISPSLWWNNQSLALTAPGFSKRFDYRNKRLYLSIADEGGTMQDGMLMIPRGREAILWVRRSHEKALDESLFADIRPMESYRDAAAGFHRSGHTFDSRALRCDIPR